MKKHIFLFLMLGFAMAPSHAAAPASGMRALVQKEARMLVDAVETGYGPLLLKEKTVGLNWEDRKTRFLSDVERSQSAREVYAAILRLFAALKDAHVHVSIPSSYAIKFPLQFMAVDSKILLNYEALDGLAKTQCPLAAGDELVGIENHFVDSIFDGMGQVLHVGNIRSTRALQAYNLSSWTEANGLSNFARKTDLGHLVAKFTFRSKPTQSTFDCVLEGAATGTPLVSFPLNSALTDEEAFKAARVEMQRLIEATRDPLKKNKSELASIDTLPLSILDKKNLGLALKTMQLQNKLFALSNARLFDEADVDESLFPAGEQTGVKVKLGQEKPFFKLPRHFRRIGGFGAGLPVIGTPFIHAAGFYAGVFKHGGKRIGFLRIPSYMPSGTLKLLLSDFSLRALLAKLEARSDVLIIDQTHNPGGAVVLSDWLVGALVGDYDMSKHMKFAVRPRGEWLSTFSELTLQLKQIEDKENLAGQDLAESPKKSDIYLKNHYLAEVQAQYEKAFAAFARGDYLSEPLSEVSISAYLRDVIDAVFRKLYKHGRLTIAGGVTEALFPLHGMQALRRGQVYTKPVYMLIDELDFSGGDATPAVLQDYGRVTLVGVNTAGAGGTVEEFKSEGALPVSYRLTTSLMIRPGGRTVENTGVHPDVAFELTEDDVASGFVNVLPRLLEKLGL